MIEAAPRSQQMRTVMIIGGVAFGVVASGTVGGLSGVAVGDFGGRSDPESVWFLSLIVGAALELAIAIAFILRHNRADRLGLIATSRRDVRYRGGVAVVALVAWQRRP